MLMQAHKYSINGKTASGNCVLNTAFMDEIVSYGTRATMAKFIYYEKPENRRCHKSEWIIDNTVAEIRTVINTPFAQIGMMMAVFPFHDITRPIQRVGILLPEIVKVYPYAPNHAYSWVLCNYKGFRVDRFLVQHHYLDFVMTAETGSTSTTTSTTSTSSSTSTSTTHT